MTPLLFLSAVSLLLLSGQVSAQGIRYDPSRMGAGAAIQARRIVEWKATEAAAAAKWGKDAWQGLRSSTCRNYKVGSSKPESVCGTRVTNDLRVALQVAASPSAFDSRDPEQNAGVVVAPAPRNQYDCSACVGMAIAAAADAAMAKALGRSNTAPVFSARDLFFCSAAKPGPDCSAGWNVGFALNELTQVRRLRYPQERCLPFGTVDEIGQMSDTAVCTPTCKDAIEAGKFQYTQRVPLDTMAKVQQYIRLHGGVITSMLVPPNLVPFFKVKENRDKVWTEYKGDKSSFFAHAVVLVGYNNTGGYWLVWSSWGKEWGNNGVAKIKYGILNMLDTRDTFGIMFTPDKPVDVKARSGDLERSDKLPKGCQYYTVKMPTFMSKVAADTGVKLEALVSDNAKKVPDLGAWVMPGTKLTVCGAKPPSPTGAEPVSSNAPSKSPAAIGLVDGHTGAPTRPGPTPPAPGTVKGGPVDARRPYRGVPYPAVLAASRAEPVRQPLPARYIPVIDPRGSSASSGGGDPGGSGGGGSGGGGGGSAPASGGSGGETGTGGTGSGDVSSTPGATGGSIILPETTPAVNPLDVAFQDGSGGRGGGGGGGGGGSDTGGGGGGGGNTGGGGGSGDYGR